MAEATSWRVKVGEEETTAVFDAAGEGTRTVFVCAHGAGGHMGDRSMLALRDALVARGIPLVRFDFLYKAKGSGRPDPMPKLMATWAAVAERVRAELSPEVLVIGGRSMGGRAASMLAAEGFDCDGLLLLAYPLHPAGQPEKLRDAHLPAIDVPVLCFSGTRDDLCRRDLMEEALKKVKPTWTMHWLEGADHSFHVLKSSGRTDAEVLAEVGDTARDWIASL
ncbi:MAG TPA: alpha/beta family hydrolase [Longimicrobium sp.]|nr:alpha/beta family hydrolase [Longimicrobium sp.]